MLVWSFISFVEIISPSIEKGYAKINGKSDFLTQSNSFTYEEMQAYKWTNDNTASTAICATNAIWDDNQYQSFLIGVCTERQMYMEGWRYVVGTFGNELVLSHRAELCSLFDGDIAKINQLLNAGVDYIIWTKRYGTLNPEVEECLGHKVYQNNSVKVYSLTRSSEETDEKNLD